MLPTERWHTGGYWPIINPYSACVRRVAPAIMQLRTLVKVSTVECLLPIEIEPLEEGGYLATSEILPGFLAQGRSVAETLEIAQDVARKLIESYLEHGDPLPREMLSGLAQADTSRGPSSVGGGTATDS